VNSTQPGRSRFILIATLSAGALILGLLCVGWALLNIREDEVSVATITYKATVATEAPAPAVEVPPAEPVYPSNPKTGARMGVLSIPALELSLPIIQGTRDSDLRKGVGHFVNSVLPGQSDNCVLSGHRDTVFTKLGKMKVGDLLVTETVAGTFTYKIRRIRIVHKDDRTVIVPADHAVLTVTTCYPFRYVGSAPDRYVLSADLVLEVSSK